MASLKIVLTDAAGADLVDHIVVDLFPLHSSQSQQATGDISGTMQIQSIDITSGPFFRVMVTPANHRIVQSFVSFSGEETAIFAAPVPVDPAKVNNICGPLFDKLAPKAQGMLAQAMVASFNDGAGVFLQGSQLYSALDRFPLLKACFLNMVAKSAATNLPDGHSVLDHFGGLVRIEQDRLFLKIDPALVEETSHSNAFHAVSAALHDPLPGYKLISSFKTFDRYGNLQLTFQRLGDTGADYAVDVDIDDAQGIEHIFQVVRNSVNGPTNPYDIHDILLQQKPPVDPGYAFVFAGRAGGIADESAPECRSRHLLLTE